MRRGAEPAPGQESVWDYPRPPALEKVADRLRVNFAGEVVADTRAGFRVLETSHPPVYYFPASDVRIEWLVEDPSGSYCEFKGEACYWSLAIGASRSARAAWSYPAPTPAYEVIAGAVAFYASRVEACWVGDERVQPQAGDFYGGWITSAVIGPFKGGPGTRGW